MSKNCMCTHVHYNGIGGQNQWSSPDAAASIAYDGNASMLSLSAYFKSACNRWVFGVPLSLKLD